jgi:hypothetical protein
MFKTEICNNYKKRNNTGASKEQGREELERLLKGLGTVKESSGRRVVSQETVLPRGEKEDDYHSNTAYVQGNN